jgi:hypothetical protein
MQGFVDELKNRLSGKLFSVNVVSVTTPSSFKVILGDFEKRET